MFIDIFFFKQKTAYKMRISDWSSYVCSSNLYPSALRRSFKDAKIQRLENMANDVAVGLAVLVAAKREDARRAEEDRLRAEEAARRRNEAKRLAYIEERRLKVLEALLGSVEQHARLRRAEARRDGTQWVSTCRSRWAQ